ncbi:Tripeptidyl-peptidase sed1 [Penicillium canariense]|uniref:Tripeptidyl-peptidase sed1 n=1 Tax=Penicillium canariense TaxID=189055 RepID=A0A9W9IDU0_9EURO|nr:Tripeptidyl-peptidase sed1 [Penicillium canariense]KAJ5175794.1 Tripeptidyl-peptidase sed1 [Penicillium canariense]
MVGLRPVARGPTIGPLFSNLASCLDRLDLGYSFSCSEHLPSHHEVVHAAPRGGGGRHGPARPHDYEIHERRDYIPNSWIEGKKLDGVTTLPVRIGLTQSNLDRGHDLLMEMANPSSSSYGRHMTEAEVHDFFSPSQATVDNVRSWLESSGIAVDRVSHSANKQWLQFDASADELEQLLRAEYYLYSHADTGRSHIACREYHVPRSVREHIDYITPGVTLREVTGIAKASRGGKEKRHIDGTPARVVPIVQGLADQLLGGLGLLDLCDVAVTPSCIQEMYNIPQGNSATEGNELAIFEDIGDVYAQEDFDIFFGAFASDIPIGTHPKLQGVDGGEAPTSFANAGPESDLDFQISYPIIWPQNSILFQTDDMVYEANYTFQGFLNTFLDAIDGSYCDEISPLDPPYPDPQAGGYKGSLQCGVYKKPNVVSISYGGAEADLPIAYQRRQCNEFMKLGMQGVSVVVASGDSGVAGRGGDPTPSNCLGADGTVFAPDFPASCPYLTAVGATIIPTGSSASAHQEVAVTRFPSGGGFSNIYERPSYQSQAVADYFAKANPTYPYYESVNNNSFGANGGIYNRIGRGYPDVSAIGDNVIIVNKLVPTAIGGTSASAPVFAAILTRINEERLAAGKPTVGFVNPVLYAHPEAFFDVTQGNNAGCGTNGFSAAEGWDPVTGMGTPNYPALLKVFMDQ